MADTTATAVVLRRTDSGESDRRLTLLSREYGKLDVVAKGARKAGSRLAGSSEPLVLATFTYAAGRQRRFVTSVQPLTSHPGLRADYLRLLAGLALGEITALALPYESPAPKVYDLIVAALAALDKHPDPLAALAWAQTRLLEVEGHLPAWTVCAVTGAPLSENPAWFSPIAGGHVASAEATPFPDRTAVRAEALIALERLGGLPAPPARLRCSEECLGTLFLFWRSLLESPLPTSKRLLETVHESNPACE